MRDPLAGKSGEKSEKENYGIMLNAWFKLLFRVRNICRERLMSELDPKLRTDHVMYIIIHLLS